MRRNEEQIAIYSRKSKFTGKGESIGNQVELCKEYVRNMFGEEYVDRCVVFEDEGFSGGNLQRPDFKRMMEEVRKRKFKAIVVYRLDRISRNISDFTGLIDELTKLDVSFVSIKEQFDTSTPMGRAMMFILSMLSFGIFPIYFTISSAVKSVFTFLFMIPRILGAFSIVPPLSSLSVAER